MNEKEFIEEINLLGIEITKYQLNQLEQYYELLIEWNLKINLTNIVEKEDVYLKHFYDSLTLSKAKNLNESLSLCDVGTGAGFPGIVLKIVYPNLKITLIDSLGKRILFLTEVIDKLKLKDIEIINIRGEDYSKSNRNKFDIVTCRAVANLSTISEICIPMTKVGGYFIPMKGNVDKELENPTFLNQLCSKIVDKIEFNLPKEQSKRTLIKILKEKDTPIKYPRTYEKIKKQPL